MPIVLNQSADGKVVIRATSNESYVVVGNNSVSNLCAAADLNSVNVQSAHITKIIWSSQVANGHIQIARPNSSANVIMYDCYGTNVLDLKALGIASNSAADLPQANLNIFFLGTVSSNGFVIIELKKDVKVYQINSPNQ